MEYRLTFGLVAGEYGGGAVELEKIDGIDGDSLGHIALLVPGAEVSVEPSSVGKGAAGPGFDLVIKTVEEALWDGAALITVGAALRSIVRAVRRNRAERRLVVKDRFTAGSIAADSYDNKVALAGSRYVATVMLTRGSLGIGIDERDIWASTFEMLDRCILVIFSSPSGLTLGSVRIPAAYDELSSTFKSPEEIALAFKDLNS